MSSLDLWVHFSIPSLVGMTARLAGLYPDGEHPTAFMMRGTPAGRAGQPAEIAAAAVFLASEEAAYVHGTVLDVDGGRTGTAVIAYP